MADECGLIDLYRQAYYMASGVAHSEWWSVETHAMERCLNVLHGGHLIPSLSLNSGANVKLASSWIDQLYALIRTSLTILGTDRDAVGEHSHGSTAQMIPMRGEVWSESVSRSAKVFAALLVFLIVLVLALLLEGFFIDMSVVAFALLLAQLMVRCARTVYQLAVS